MTRSERKRRRAACAVGIAIGLRVMNADASPVLELVGSTFGTGGFNARATGASAASAYFNPALLPEADQGFSIGTFVLNDAISIALDGRSSRYDVPESALNNFNDGNRAIGTFPAVPTQWLERGCQVGQGQCTTNLPARPRQGAGSSGEVRLYQAIGFVSHIVPSRLTLGIYALVPMKSLIAAHSFYPDEREQFFTNSLHPELYSDRLSALSLAFGTGLRVTDWLSLGASATVNMATTAAASGYIGDSSNLKDTLRQSMQLESAAAFAPHFAAVVKPIERLRLSATLHTIQKAEIATTTTTFLPNGDYQSAPRSAVHNWLPVIAGLGVAFELLRQGEHALSVTGTGTFQGWSQYMNRQGETPLRNYHWNDSLQGALGVRYTYNEKLATFLDGSYRPTPVPLQSGRTNYVDNDVFGIGAGANYDIPIESWSVTLRVGLQGQVHLLRERHQTKIDPTSPNLAGSKYSQIVVDEWSDNAVDSRPQTIPAAQGLQTNNPGWPGFASEGFLLGTGVSVAVIY